MNNKSVTAVHTRYRNKAGKQVPGVTSVIGLLNKPALVNWAWKLGLEGQDMNKVRDKAAEIGTLTHYLCECKLKGETPDLSEFKPSDLAVANPMYRSFCKWYDRQKIKAIAIERGLVSENWQYGGTIDLVALEHTLRVLFDIKTSRGVYDEYKIQLSAYVEDWNENYPYEAIDLVKVIHLDKETGKLELHEFGMKELKDPYFEIFKHLRAIYVLMKRTELNIGGKKWEKRPKKR